MSKIQQIWKEKVQKIRTFSVEEVKSVLEQFIDGSRDKKEFISNCLVHDKDKFILQEGQTSASCSNYYDIEKQSFIERNFRLLVQNADNRKNVNSNHASLKNGLEEYKMEADNLRDSAYFSKLEKIADFIYRISDSANSNGHISSARIERFADELVKCEFDKSDIKAGLGYNSKNGYGVFTNKEAGNLLNRVSNAKNNQVIQRR